MQIRGRPRRAHKRTRENRHFRRVILQNNPHPPQNNGEATSNPIFIIIR